ncbi:coiled-coil domain-containing protein 115 [Ahaetulla prasina]|uniref:coiled-coil domain-containing protein 115 n=1 Tax=Ahaetulla prasina TaxID=499056 RepID=UPI0026489EDA|nr:coiled-coil domain-containing protein 115 [Ahaetulla prasina]XP_058023180.1 coiled-coil domain-containing protein 115 [Ahaetulla prasina]XP_058023181.1 coiled-coil domain-containing protein 115 [Ahaetulla prasina]
MAPAVDIGQIEICEELDRVILHLFDALEILQTKREAFNSMVEQGWFSLSKSRYAMGNKSVSTLQYGHQMTPLVRIETGKADDGQTQFHVITDDAFKGKDESPNIVEEIGPSEQVLRRRKGPGKAEDVAQPQNTASQPAESLGHQDPLNWFGILVPQSLRQAQKIFREGINLAAEIASIQSEIEATRSYYQLLLEKKQKLVAGKKQYSP